jgi:hypothetical protein
MAWRSVFLQRSYLDKELFEHAIEHYGRSARIVFLASSDVQSRDLVDSNITRAIAGIVDPVQAVEDYAKGVVASHAIFEVDPDETDTNRRTFAVRFTSKSTMELLLDSVRIKMSDKIFRFYEFIKHILSMESAAGSIFEDLVHKLFQGNLKSTVRLVPLFERPNDMNKMTKAEKNKLSHEISQRRAAGTVLLNLEEVGPIDFHVCGSDSEFEDTVHAAVQKGAPFYVRPVIRNYAGIDAFLCIPSLGKVYVLQITRSHSHAIAVLGF